ncbi:hypothetical protein BSL78_10931 [Apostichopus japonicus]|uniref:Uncharacterized protein n=1 Tax=Stichopus japonicus TaxID=307972 RepID=A0A2G8KW05_STIJA|nr:hypothetical protein BSL78_10931 [Apostichopus japonicus]
MSRDSHATRRTERYYARFPNTGSEGNQRLANVERFLELVKQLHAHYHHQLDTALVSTHKFNKCQKYFVQALRTLAPDYKNLMSLSQFEELIKTADTEATRDLDDDDDFAMSLIELFLFNIQNFRLLRHYVKMNILSTLKQLPQSLETDSQRRVREDVEVLLSSWGILLALDTDLQRLEHPNKGDITDSFKDEHERNYFEGVLSLMPKLIDLANKMDFVLTKYYLKTPLNSV